MSSKHRFLIVGGGGRESAFAQKLMEDSIVFAVTSHANPDIVDAAEKSGGRYLLGDNNDPQTVLRFAQEHNIDYAFINADTPLANGVVDKLLAHDIKAIGGTQAATRIEWDKIFSIEMMQKVCPTFTPFFRIVEKREDIAPQIQAFIDQGMQLVVKPQGLTGGKGVKVMPDHLTDYEAAKAYILELLQTRPQEKVLLVEKLAGIEFTIMGMTDGEHLVLAPASYDYPFRHAEDTGPGTGGMGCFTDAGKCLPFMDERDLADCRQIMQKILDEMRTCGLHFSGVLNGGFFKTRQGIRFMEFNGRFGDPEALNVLSLMESSFAQLLISLWEKTLSEETVQFSPKASVINYLVAKEYPNPAPAVTKFSVDEAALHRLDMKIFFASCIRQGSGQSDSHSNKFETLKTSRVVALGALADTIEQASAQVNEAIQKYIKGNLDYRPDIGSKQSLEKLKAIKQAMTR